MRDIPLSELPPPVLPPPPVELESTSDIGNPNWRAWTAPLALLVVLIIATVVGAVLGGIVISTGGKADDPPAWFTVVSTAVQDGAFIAVPLYLAFMVGKIRLRDFGFTETRFWPAVGWAALAWGATIAVLAVVSQLVGYDETDRLPQELGADKSTLALVSVGLMVTVLAPIAEEFFFRGYFFPAVANRLGKALSAAVTGVVFGGIHLFNYLDKPVEAGLVALPYLMVLGAALCLIYWRTKSLLPCIALHSFNNAVAFGVSLEWEAWQVLLAIVIANLLCAAVVWPLVRRVGREVV